MAEIKKKALPKTTTKVATKKTKKSLEKEVKVEKKIEQDSQKPINILHIASEAAPFIKTGGLADVVGALSKYQVQLGNKVSVVIPKYGDIPSEYAEKMEFVKHFDVYMSWRKQYAGVFKYQKDNVDYYFIDNEYYFKRVGIYGYGDDGERFGFFTIAALELIAHLQLKINIIHTHDWHTGMAATLYHEHYKYFEYFSKIHFILTIHNPAYQGNYNKNILGNIFGLNQSTYDKGLTKFKDGISYLKSAIVYSDFITTVSPSHALELLSGDFAYDLEGILNSRKDCFKGIINGIDYAEYNPATDKYLEFKYTNPADKFNNKEALQKKVKLPIKNVPVLTIISRLTWQKGIELVVNSIDELMKEDIQLVIIGSGDHHYEKELEDIRNKYPDKIAIYIGFNNALAHLSYAGSDYLLMPSLFEPCGINQMIALRYGTIPIVRECGGLKDTIIPFNEYELTGNGFSFQKFDLSDYVKIVKYALSFYNNKKVISKIIENGQSTKLDWESSAKEYLDLYRQALKNE